MTKQINEAGNELVVDSIRILKGDGLTGAGAATIKRKLQQIEQSVTLIEESQQDYWSGIGDDKVITPVEKLTLQKEKAIIDAEKPSIEGRAAAAGITSMLVYQTYEAMYTSLNTMLNNIGVFDDMSSNTEIQDREAFNEAYEDYYEARDALQDAITKGYISEGQGTLDRDAVPGLNLSAYVVKTNAAKTVYTPSRITIKGEITNGTYTDPYSSIIEIFRNGEETPSVKTSITKIHIYDIPAGTTSLRVVMLNVEGKLVYDDEIINIFDGTSEQQLVLSNTYQTFVNGTKTKQESGLVDLTCTVEGYSNGYPRTVQGISVSSSPSLKVTVDDNDVIHMSPEDEILTSGTFTVTAAVHDPQVLGAGDNLVIGIPDLDLVIGQVFGTTISKDIQYRNYDTLALDELKSEEVENATKSYYLGAVSDPQLLQNVVYGNYFLYTGNDTTTWQKGSLYLWNGQRWVFDFNNEHNTVAMTDMFTMLESMPGLANEFIKNLVSSTAFIKQLFSKYITIQDKGHIKSENYNGVFNSTTGAIDTYGDTGWAIDSNGKSDFVNLHATNSTIEGIIDAKSLALHPIAGDVVLRKINVSLINTSKIYYSQICASGSCRIKILNVRYNASSSSYVLGSYTLSIYETGEVIATGQNEYIADVVIKEGQTFKLDCYAGGMAAAGGCLALDFYICTDNNNGILAYLGNYYSEDASPGPRPR